MRKPTRASVSAVGGALALTSIAFGAAPVQAAPKAGQTKIHTSSVYPHVGVGTGAKSFTVTYRVTDSGSGVKRVAASAHNGKARLSATKTTCRGPSHDVTCTLMPCSCRVRARARARPEARHPVGGSPCVSVRPLPHSAARSPWRPSPSPAPRRRGRPTARRRCTAASPTAART